MFADRSLLVKNRYMKMKGALLFLAVAMVLACGLAGCSDRAGNAGTQETRRIITSDTILADMAESLLPPDRYSVEAILPPGQCPGHYDVKLTDIEKMKKAALNVSFRGTSFMDKAGSDDARQLVMDPGGHNWMAPVSYVRGLKLLADRLSEHFPEDRTEIARRREHAISRVNRETDTLIRKISEAGLSGKPVIASSMQREPLEWMGFVIVAEYGRQEALSARDIVRLARIGAKRGAIMIVDNLQSGPDTGKGIAEILKAPRVVLTNFPSEEGYLVTLGQNVDALLAAVRK